MENPKMTIAEAKKIDLVEYLASLGHQPKKVSGVDYWYNSPLRIENTPSFKVNSKLNLWFDFGTGKGGTIIDFGIQYFGCDIAEFLGRLEGIVNKNNFSFHQQSIGAHQEKATQKPKINVKAIREIQNSQWKAYIENRCISYDIASKYLKEVMMVMGEKEYSLLGFKNNSGGFELKGIGDFKSCLPPKDYTTFETGNNALAVVEGMFDFLSHETRSKKIVPEPTDWLVLNSISFLEKAKNFMNGYERIYLMLDNDEAGKGGLKQLLSLSPRYMDLSHHYQYHKDLNEMLKHEIKIEESLKMKQQQSPRRWLRM
jgi:hypothetical protein